MFIEEYVWFVVLTMIAIDMLTSLITAYLFINGLYKIMYQQFIRSEEPPSRSISVKNQTSNEKPDKSQTPTDNRYNQELIDVITKYSLLITIIICTSIIHVISLFLLNTLNPDHDAHGNFENLQHCITSISIFIESLCLYFSSKIS